MSSCEDLSHYVYVTVSSASRLWRFESLSVPVPLSLLHQCLGRFEALSVSVWLSSTSVSVKFWVTGYISSVSLLRPCLAVKVWVAMSAWLSILHPVFESLSHYVRAAISSKWVYVKVWGTVCVTLLHPCLWRFESRSMSMRLSFVHQCLWRFESLSMSLLHPCLAVKVWVTVCVRVAVFCIHVCEGLGLCLCLCHCPLYQCLGRFMYICQCLCMCLYLYSAYICLSVRLLLCTAYLTGCNLGECYLPWIFPNVMQ